jgi:alkanesulfonate monooxygenase SsuD/methylene tetrahydromethanopterin reductase-like flavin-dependent oxidoreductase (luciferase family)
MTEVDVGLVMPKTPTRPREVKPDSAVETAIRAEELGFHSLWNTEGWEEDTFVRLTQIAVHTDEIQLATGITSVFARTPATLAMAAATLQRVSDGRFVLGLGPSHKEDVEETHGVLFDRPVRRIHETAEIVRSLTGGDGDPVEYDGDIFDVRDTRSFTDVDPPRIFNAALGAANRRATGRVCDGWLPHNLPFALLPELFSTIDDASREVGRDPDEIDVYPLVPTVVSDDGERAKRELRKHVAYYVGSWEEYRRAVEDRFPEESAELAAAYDAAGDRDGGEVPSAIHDIIGDDMLEAFGVAGESYAAREQFAAITDMDIVDVPVLFVPMTVDGDRTRKTIEAVNPSLL